MAKCGVIQFPRPRMVAADEPEPPIDLITLSALYAMRRAALEAGDLERAYRIDEEAQRFIDSLDD